jgi:carbamoyl-phosphate synthase large subunit
LWFVGEAIRRGWTLEKIQGFTRYDPWFLKEIECLIATESIISQSNFSQIQKSELISWKKLGFCDKRLAHLLRVTEEEIWEKRSSLSIHPTYKRIDSCAAEFSTETAYLYSTFEEECEARPSSKEKIVVLGSGPNRIGQGIEFDYCCVHALQAIRELGYEAVMINCNPATVSTDCDRSDRLYIEPLCAEKVHEIIRLENPLGVIIQFGGQSPLDVGKQLYARGIDALGTSFHAIDRCEDRDKFRKLVRDLSLDQPKNNSFSEPWQAFQEAAEIGYPLLLRPSYVIGGSFIQVINNEGELEEYLKNSPPIFGPVLMEEFLEGGIEVEVDAIGDGHEIFICGVVEHLDPVGIHSGDSICSLSPLKLGTQIQAELKKQTVKIGLSLGIIGLFNVQFCVVDQQTVFVLEVNPRASRTIPLLSKVTGIPFVRVATRCILGRSLKMQGYEGEAIPHFFGVKVPVFPFNRMRVFKKNLGPTMLSTGEVLGIGKSYREAFAKAAVSIDPSLALSSAVQDEVAALLPAGDYVIYQLGKGSF